MQIYYFKEGASSVTMKHRHRSRRDNYSLKVKQTNNNKHSIDNPRKPFENMGVFYDPAETYNLGSVGKCNKVCKFCRALKFPREADRLCCNKGHFKLAPLKPLPPEIQKYMDPKKHPYSKSFLEEIRSYSNCFQMTSFGTKKSTGGTNFY